MSYIICFWDKSKIQVDEETGVKLKEAISAETIKTFELNASLYSVAGIEKIIPKDEAFDVYPLEWELLKKMNDRFLPNNQLKQLENKTLV